MLVDSNVLLDLLQDDSDWASWSQERLDIARTQGPIFINLIVYAEIAGNFASAGTLDDFLRRSGLIQRPLSYDVAFRAGEARTRYRANRGEKTRLLADFLIGAQAELEGWALLTRDPRPYRTYFPDVRLITP